MTGAGVYSRYAGGVIGVEETDQGSARLEALQTQARAALAALDE